MSGRWCIFRAFGGNDPWKSLQGAGILRFFPDTISRHSLLAWILSGVVGLTPFSRSSAQDGGTTEGGGGTVERVRPLSSRPLVFSRTQSQYSLAFNYLHWYTPEWYWIDRPLFFDKALGVDGKYTSEISGKSFGRSIDIAKSYELDGFSHLVAGAGQQRNYGQALVVAAAHSDPPFPLLMEVAGTGGSVDQIVADVGRCLEKALASPAAQRSGGKILITSYVLDLDTPETWAKAIAALREKYGDTFLVVASLGRDWWAPYARSKDGRIRESDLKALRAKLRSWLDVCDGVMYVGIGHDVDPENLNRLDQKFYAYLIDVFSKVLSEPAYKTKYFGLSAAIGYFNPVISVRNNEDGTKYLRDSLRMALDAHPDFVILPEWDEVNESTSIQPTVYNSSSTQRIIRHEMRRIKGELMSPIDGDDISIPNLVISYRPFIKLGETLDVEVLNVPDGTAHDKWKVQMRFKDLNRKVVKEMPAEELNAESLGDVTFHTPSEELAGYPVVMPSLEVTWPDGKKQVYEDGLVCIRLYPTMNWNYKWVKTPLRDLAHLESAVFDRVESPNSERGDVSVKGAVTAREPIKSVEVVGEGLELFAASPKEDRKVNPDEAVIIMYESTPETIQNYLGKYYVTGGGVRVLGGQFAFWATRPPGQESPILTNSPLGQVFSVSNRDSAVIHIENSVFKTQIAVADILKNGIYSEVHGRGITLTLAPFAGVPEMPFSLRDKEISFDTAIKLIRSETSLQMRVITESGKIYNSWPLVVEKKAPENQPVWKGVWSRITGAFRSDQDEARKVLLPVYSETAKGPVSVMVDRSSIPEIQATPERTFGAEIHASADSYFNGKVGGVPFWSYVVRKESSYPKAATETAPKRVSEDGLDCWSFDGKGNFLYFPPETLPRGAFTISFKFKPVSPKRQTLLANSGYLNGAFRLNMENGVLSATYTDLILKKEPYARTKALAPGIAVPINEWSDVEIVYNLKDIVFKVNGKAANPIPLSAGGAIFDPLIFGGFGSDGFFEGYLAGLKITHNAALAKQE